MSPTLCWAVAVVLFAITEGLSIGLTSIWFAVGALVSMIVSFFVESLWVQVWVFLIVSLVTLIALRPVAAKYFTQKGHTPTNSDRIIGREAVVKEEICNLESRGLVQVIGQKWTARSSDERVIPAGAIVIIDRIEGVKVFVTPKDETAGS